MTNAKTVVPKAAEVSERWYVIDAKNQILGRLAAKVATVLRGKDRPDFSPHLAGKTHVIIINAAAVSVTGNKLEAKRYYRHGRVPGSLRSRTLSETLEKFPTRPVEGAIRKMLPDNKLRQVWMNHLHVYAEDKHDHEAQKPEVLT